jgi:hypothetical protein
LQVDAFQALLTDLSLFDSDPEDVRSMSGNVVPDSPLHERVLAWMPDKSRQICCGAAG